MSQELYGPRTELSRILHKMKYRGPEETFDDYCVRYARSTTTNEKDFRKLLKFLRTQTILPAGRQQLSVGRPFQTTCFNCFTGPTIGDHTKDIFDTVTLGALTMRTGGGVGWDFSTIRPKGEPIRGLGIGAVASGPVSFMNVWNAMCQTIISAGERRGAMMGVLRVDHPDILTFINAKKDDVSLKYFNISVAVTDKFMEAVYCDGLYDLQFNGVKFGSVRALDVWAVIMENNWDYAEPGILFIDRINRLNPLYYCEKIATCNPCAEQPLPPSGACLLASQNLVKFIQTESTKKPHLISDSGKPVKSYSFDFDMLDESVDATVRACDAVIDISYFPLPEQKEEALAKRRMGIGVTGMANVGEILGFSYGDENYLELQSKILQRILFQAYRSSIELAKEKGSFPLFDADKYLEGEFISKTLPDDIKDGIRKCGLRNGLLTSIAPTGTISLVADNVSSGIEPVFFHEGKRDIITPEGKKEFEVVDFAHNFYNVKGRTANEVTAQEHIKVLCEAQQFVDSSISKTCNVYGQIGGKGEGVNYNDFKELYMTAYKGGAKSCTTYNINGKRSSIFRTEEVKKSKKTKKIVNSSDVCTYDPITGTRSCAE